MARVVLYGHAGCPGTRRAREYFLANGIAFVERDIAGLEASAEMRRWGAWATPFLVVGGRLTMIGFDAREFDELLRQAAEGG